VGFTSSTSTGKDIGPAGGSRRSFRSHRLAYSFGWEGREAVPPGSSLIEIDPDRPGRAGRTLLRMTHSGLPDAAACASHELGLGPLPREGWPKFASGGDAGSRPPGAR